MFSLEESTSICLQLLGGNTLKVARLKQDVSRHEHYDVEQENYVQDFTQFLKIFFIKLIIGTRRTTHHFITYHLS